MTLRAERPLSIVKVTPDLISLTFPLACGVRGADDTLLGIRRTGCCDNFIMAYPFLQTTLDGRAEFRLDAALHKLTPGEYDAVLLDGCRECGTIRLSIPACPGVMLGGVQSTTYEPVPDPGAAIEGVTPMFDDFYGWKAKTTCPVFPTDVVIKIAPDLPAAATTPALQLVLHDGVNSEIVTLMGGASGYATVTRGSPRHTFPKGACLQFEWTPANVTAAATPVDCPACPEDTTPGGLDACTVLEPGKGLVLRTNEAGKVIVELAPTGVTPGDYGGLTVDDCGRITGVDVQFPASAIPVFDTCCKDN